MPDKIDAIIALLSDDKPLSSDQIKDLQADLSDQGHVNNADRYPNPDGVMGSLTQSDIIDFIAQNPEALLTISPTMVQTLRDKGLGDELQNIVDENPSIQNALAQQAKTILDGQNVDRLHGTPELKEFQTKAALLGSYSARIDGFTGSKSREAADGLNEQFAPQQTTRPVKRPDLEAATQDADALEPTRDEPTSAQTRAAEPEPEEAVVEADAEQETSVSNTQDIQESITALYMKALDFDERGLKIGDGGEKNWSQKRDPQVWNLQVLLNRAGADIAVDGDYGGGTAGAVRQFQKDNDLPITGQADFETLKTLASLPETQFTVAAQDNPKMYTIVEQHRIMEDIAGQMQSDTRVSSGFLKSLRGMETHFGTDMSSGTGSKGPYQFTGGTFTEIINRYGEQIADNLRGLGQDDLADEVLQSQAGNVDRTLRYDPYISTYAAAYLTRQNGVNTLDQDNWGEAYAAHNIGGGGLRTLKANLNTSNVGAVLDRKYDPDPARNNPYFFRGGVTGQGALNRYQDEMETWHGEYDKRVEPQLQSIRDMEALQLSQQIASIAPTSPAVTMGRSA
ncbi:MAG: hypothetical protein GW778_06150 [Alphaproteobacteria bacterium]|nr:hypothetical protein [Alphaproteobacteria bacterium]